MDVSQLLLFARHPVINLLQFFILLSILFIFYMILYEKRCTINIYKKDFKSPLHLILKEIIIVYTYTRTQLCSKLI